MTEPTAPDDFAAFAAGRPEPRFTDRQLAQA